MLDNDHVTPHGSAPVPNTTSSGPDRLADGHLSRAMWQLGLDALALDRIAAPFHAPLVRLGPAWSDALAASTLEARRVDFRRFARWCAAGSVAPLASDRDLAEAMQGHLAAVEQTLSPGTVRRVAASLTALARGVGADPTVCIAHRRRLAIAATPQRGREGSHREGSPEKRWLTDAELRKLYAAIEAGSGRAGSGELRRARDYAVLSLTCDVFARRAELAAFRLRDFDLAAGTIRIECQNASRTGRGAVYRLSPRTWADIKTWLQASGLGSMPCPDPSALPLFAAILPDGRLRKGARGLPAPLTGRSISRILTGLGDAAGLPDVSSTAIRRSMARLLRAHGIDDGEIAVRGRWSSITQMRASVGLAPPEHGAPSLVR